MHTIVLRSDSVRMDNPLLETVRILFPECRVVIMNIQDPPCQRDVSYLQLDCNKRKKNK